MNRKLLSGLALGGALAVVAVGATSALAATAPWQPGTSSGGDPANVGSVKFYNSAGQQIASGSTTAPIAAYVGTTGLTPLTGNTKAVIYMATPQSGVNPGNWNNEATSGAKAFPPAGAPAPVSGFTTPTASTTSSDKSINAYIGDYPDPDSGADANGNPTDTTGYDNVYEIRVYDTGSSGVDTNYASGDIQVNPVTNTWTQVYPVINSAATSTALSVTPTSPATTGTDVKLTATVSSTTAGTINGTVTFYDGSTALNSTAATLSGGTASYTVTGGLAKGSHSLTAVFTPSDLSYATSTSAAQTYVENGQVISTTTTLAVTPPASGNAYDNGSYTATVQAASGTAIAAGTVYFYDNGSSSSFASAPVTGSANPGTATVTSNALGAGSHSIVAKFVPTDSTSYSASQSAASSAFSLNAVGATPDPQTITVTVAPGALTISTPYTASAPFNLGTAVLNPQGTALTASKQFGSTTVFPSQASGGAITGYDGITITDTRAGDQAWTASAASTDFSDGSGDSIAASGLSLTGVAPHYIASNALQSGSVTTKDITSFTSSPQAFATAAKGNGSVYVSGLMGLTAPTSTVAGTYTATVTFTLA